MDVRAILNELERARFVVEDASKVMESARKIISETSSRLYDRDRYVESLEARLLELSQPANDQGAGDPWLTSRSRSPS